MTSINMYKETPAGPSHPAGHHHNLAVNCDTGRSMPTSPAARTLHSSNAVVSTIVVQACGIQTVIIQKYRNTSLNLTRPSRNSRTPTVPGAGTCESLRLVLRPVRFAGQCVTPPPADRPGSKSRPITIPALSRQRHARLVSVTVVDRSR